MARWDASGGQDFFGRRLLVEAHERGGASFAGAQVLLCRSIISLGLHLLVMRKGLRQSLERLWLIPGEAYVINKNIVVRNIRPHRVDIFTPLLQPRHLRRHIQIFSRRRIRCREMP